MNAQRQAAPCPVGGGGHSGDAVARTRGFGCDRGSSTVSGIRLAPAAAPLGDAGFRACL